MWELILKHLPTFGWILGGAVVLAGMLKGAVESAEKVLGKDIRFLEKASYFLLISALGSSLGGIKWLLLVSTGKVSENHIFLGLLIGGLIGSVIAGISLKYKLSKFSKEIAETTWTVGAGVGAFAGMFVGIVGSAFVNIPGGIIGGVLVGGRTTQVHRDPLLVVND